MDQQTEKRLPKLYGIPFPPGFPEDTIRSAINYKAKKDDLFIVSYPKCGSTWMQHIVLLILQNGKISDDPLDFFLGSPFLELTGAEAAEDVVRSGAIKTHLPYNLVPKSKEAKYIYVCRNPKDCVVSFYYYLKSRPNSTFEDQTFDEFFEHFMRADVPYGDYFDHVTDWFEHRDDPNVYIITYENLKNDTRGEILKLAKFIGEEYEKSLLNDPKVLDDVIHYSSFEHMRKGTNETMLQYVKGEISKPSSLEGERKLPSGLLRVMDGMRKAPSSRNPTLEFVRKGIVGDWQNHLNPDQVRRIEEIALEKTAKSEFMRLWE